MSYSHNHTYSGEKLHKSQIVINSHSPYSRKEENSYENYLRVKNNINQRSQTDIRKIQSILEEKNNQVQQWMKKYVDLEQQMHQDLERYKEDLYYQMTLQMRKKQEEINIQKLQLKQEKQRLQEELKTAQNKVTQLEIALERRQLYQQAQQQQPSYIPAPPTLQQDQEKRVYTDHSEVDEMSQAYEARKQKDVQTICKLMQEKKELQSDNEQKKQTVTQLQQQLDQAHNEIQKLKDRIKQKETEQSHTERYQAVQTNCEDRFQQLQEYYDKLKEEHKEEIEAQEREHQNEIDKLKERIKELEASR